MVLLLVGWIVGVTPVAQPADSDFLGLVPVIVQTATADARLILPNGTATGPLLLDIDSFVREGRRLTGVPVDRRRVAAAVHQAFSDLGNEQAILCASATETQGCSVAHDGLYISVEELRQSSSGVEAFIVYKWTDRRQQLFGQRSSIGRRRIVVSYSRESGGWARTEVQVLEQT
jgi:hypothetical protein